METYIIYQDFYSIINIDIDTAKKKPKLCCKILRMQKFCQTVSKKHLCWWLIQSWFAK